MKLNDIETQILWNFNQNTIWLLTFTSDEIEKPRISVINDILLDFKIHVADGTI